MEINDNNQVVNKVEEVVTTTQKIATEAPEKTNNWISTLVVALLSLVVLGVLVFSVIGNPFKKGDMKTTTNGTTETKKEEVMEKTDAQKSEAAAAEIAKKAINELFSSATCSTIDIAANGGVSCTITYKTEPTAAQIANSLIIIGKEGGNIYSPDLPIPCKATAEKVKLLCDVPSSTLQAGKYVVNTKLWDQYSPIANLLINVK
jgi:hypothetical protein